ncbi:MAG TPA: carboxypeptidase-like regulatory domain-containing protein, partial [Candidatus Saccharimonadales bacterium]|nr:carboxypeptidase-like regulatory domain-containing protein [Candidatus Saccharimonadales bacterium]
VAGTKTVTLKGISKGTYIADTTTVTFSAVSTPSSGSTSGSLSASNSSTSESPKPTATTSAPVKPSLSVIRVGSTVITDATPTIDQNQPLVLSGKTVPNGIVTLTIHSTPKTVTTTADKNGNWTYSVSGLAPGNHTIQASVKDPTTGKSSTPAQLLAFSVKAAPVAAVTTVKTLPKTSSALPLMIGLVVLVLLAGGGWYYWTKMRTKKISALLKTPDNQPKL